jgi:hypothetical protein
MLISRRREGKSCLEDVVADNIIITKRIFNKWDESVRGCSIWLFVPIGTYSGML